MGDKPKLPRSVDDVISWSRNQIDHPTQSWKGLCQSHCRQAYGVAAWAPSAIDAWNSIPDGHKHHGGHVGDVPRGGLLYYSGGQYGHVALAVGRNSNVNCLSNDYVRSGMIDVAPRDFPRWNLKYLGWSTYTPFGHLNLGIKGQ